MWLTELTMSGFVGLYRLNPPRSGSLATVSGFSSICQAAGKNHERKFFAQAISSLSHAMKLAER